jgi:aldose 1-epimerase
MIATDIHLCGGGYEADVSSTRGGICYRLIHKSTGADILRTPRDEEELAQNVYLYGNPPLFPPNRILGAKFTFRGKDYTLPLNEPSTGCHIHGALWRMPFKVEAKSTDSVRLVYHAKAGEYIGFPHAFTFVRSYTLSENGLCETDEITNDSDEVMPFMLAYHTTFNLPLIQGSQSVDHRVRLQVGREELRTENFIPTGEFREEGAREREMQNGEYIPYGKHLSAFYEGGGDMTLTDLSTGICLTYSADTQFTYRMLYQTADGSFFVCEPQTTAIDCFRLPGGAKQHGLVEILPHETKCYRTAIKIN